MKGIIAVNNKNVIGTGDYLPWKSSADLQHFRNLTMGGNLLVGFKTFQGMSYRPLDGRKMFVDSKVKEKYPKKEYDEHGEISSNYHYIHDFTLVEDRDVNYVNSETVKEASIDWCIGGNKTYEKYCHLFTELHISHINDDTEGDILYPELKHLNPDCKIFHYYFDVD